MPSLVNIRTIVNYGHSLLKQITLSQKSTVKKVDAPLKVIGAIKTIKRMYL